MARLKLAFQFITQSQTSDQHLRSFIRDVYSKLDNLSSGDMLKDDKLGSLLSSNNEADLVDKKPYAVNKKRETISPKNNPTALTNPKMSPTPIKLPVQTNVKLEIEDDNETIVGDDNEKDSEVLCDDPEINQMEVEEHQASPQNYEYREEYIDEEHLTDFEPVRKQRRNKTESGTGINMCTKCNKTFSTRTNLIRHMLTHENQKPYQCMICSTGFTQSGSLKQHMYIHTGERPYVCNICNAAFTQSKTLKFHMRRHTGEKPYTCLHCGMSFRQRDGLKVSTCNRLLIATKLSSFHISAPRYV